MVETVQRLLALRVHQGHLGLMFMGQAGFILKAPSGELMGIDLYLSNCCERYFGFKRLMPQLLLPGELELDHVVTSHSHYDHFDVDSIPMLMGNEKTKLYMAADCMAECQRLGLPEERCTVLRLGDCVEAGSFRIQPVPCDHGELAPDALGLYITCGEQSVYLAGDTCFRADIAEEMRRMPISFASAPINGAFGNMDGAEAARFFGMVQPKRCAPCHYWNFAEHMGDPNAFMQAMKSDAPGVDYLLLRPGETICI